VSASQLKVLNINRNQLLADQVKLANTFFKRLRGLLFTKSLPNGEALLIQPCNSIHAFGMAYSIDALFLDKENIVIATLSNLKPGQLSQLYWQARSCLELPAGTIAQSGTAIGDHLQFIN
jgi:uncharacterized membrane protein (UPF0127 family)